MSNQTINIQPPFLPNHWGESFPLSDGTSVVPSGFQLTGLFQPPFLPDPTDWWNGQSPIITEGTQMLPSSISATVGAWATGLYVTTVQFERLLALLALTEEEREFVRAALAPTQDRGFWDVLADFLEERQLPASTVARMRKMR